MGKKQKKKSYNKKKDQEIVALSGFQIKERRQRSCFVGNVPLDATTKELKSVFSAVGKVESVWFRSIPTELEGKLPQRAKVIMKQYTGLKDNKNAYVLFEKKEDAMTAVQKLNQTQIPGHSNHIRVDLDTKGIIASEKAEGVTDVDPSGLKNDTDTTIFIGNLPFSVNEEELRKHFTHLEDSHLPKAGDGIMNVRIVRDKETYLGKGIAYIMFTSKPLMRLAIEQRNGQAFMGRELRIKKAVSAQRLEKKRLKTEDVVKQKKEKRAIENLVQNENNEKENSEKKDADQVGISDKSKGIKKDDSADFRSSFKKMIKNSGQDSIEKIGIDMTPRLAFNKKKHIKVMKEKIEASGGSSRYQDLRSHEATKQVPTLKQQLRTKIEKKRKINLSNINKVKVKKVYDQ